MATNNSIFLAGKTKATTTRLLSRSRDSKSKKSLTRSAVALRNPNSHQAGATNLLNRDKAVAVDTGTSLQPRDTRSSPRCRGLLRVVLIIKAGATSLLRCRETSVCSSANNRTLKATANRETCTITTHHPSVSNSSSTLPLSSNSSNTRVTVAGTSPRPRRPSANALSLAKTRLLRPACRPSDFTSLQVAARTSTCSERDKYLTHYLHVGQSRHPDN